MSPVSLDLPDRSAVQSMFVNSALVVAVLILTLSSSLVRCQDPTTAPLYANVTVWPFCNGTVCERVTNATPPIIPRAEILLTWHLGDCIAFQEPNITCNITTRMFFPKDNDEFEREVYNYWFVFTEPPTETWLSLRTSSCSNTTQNDTVTVFVTSHCLVDLGHDDFLVLTFLLLLKLYTDLNCTAPAGLVRNLPCNTCWPFRYHWVHVNCSDFWSESGWNETGVLKLLLLLFFSPSSIQRF